jgi:hypothetical protein
MHVNNDRQSEGMYSIVPGKAAMNALVGNSVHCRITPVSTMRGNTCLNTGMLVAMRVICTPRNLAACSDFDLHAGWEDRGRDHHRHGPCLLNNVFEMYELLYASSTKHAVDTSQDSYHQTCVPIIESKKLDKVKIEAKEFSLREVLKWS